WVWRSAASSSSTNTRPLRKPASQKRIMRTLSYLTVEHEAIKQELARLRKKANKLERRMNAVRTQIDALTTHECVMVANLMGLAEGDRILVELRAGVQREALYEGIKVGVWGGLKVR